MRAAKPPNKRMELTSGALRDGAPLAAHPRCSADTGESAAAAWLTDAG